MEKWEAAYLAGIIMDGEGSITLTRMHKGEFRRPCLSITSTDLELIMYLQSLIGGVIVNKKNYKPNLHKDAITLVLKKKEQVLLILEEILPFLRINRKQMRADWILRHYNRVTLRNGKYNEMQLKEKIAFEDYFFQI